jgi:hypothetical protein
MSTGATKWIWENSRASNGSLIVLLAIAHECGEGEFTEMSVAELTRRTRLSDRAVRMAVKDLAALGELSVTPARGGVSRYAPCTTPANIAGPPRQDLPDHPGKIYRTAKSAPLQILPDLPEEPQVNGTPAKIAGPEISNVFVVTTGTSVAEVKDVPAKPARRRDDRPEVDRLCTHLADRIEANGCKRPAINQKWRDAARLMLDADGRTEEGVHKAIDWSQDHEFWRANILSMPKLREKYDQLSMQARRSPQRQQNASDSLGIIGRFMERQGGMQ